MRIPDRCCCCPLAPRKLEVAGPAGTHPWRQDAARGSEDSEGRTRVLILIRPMPDPGGMPGLHAPRGELLRELGLGEK